MACQCSVRPSGVMPLRMARTICWSVHAPIPVRASLVMLRLHSVPKGRQLRLHIVDEVPALAGREPVCVRRHGIANPGGQTEPYQIRIAASPECPWRGKITNRRWVIRTRIHKKAALPAVRTVATPAVLGDVQGTAALDTRRCPRADESACKRRSSRWVAPAWSHGVSRSIRRAETMMQSMPGA